MQRYNKSAIKKFLKDSDKETFADKKGEIFEDLVIYLFEKFGGIRLIDRDVLDNTGSQEIDLVLWNNISISPFYFLDPIIICECKNEAVPLSSAKVREFVQKLRTRGANSGILITSSGISGQLNGYRYANSVIMDALSIDRIKLIVVDRGNILSFKTTDDLLNDIIQKYLNLTIRRTLE
jgi:Restriction endonuclease